MVTLILGLCVFGYFIVTNYYDKKEADAYAAQRDASKVLSGYFNQLQSYLDSPSYSSGYGQIAWNYLSGDYKIKHHPTGYIPYTEYWKSFKKIEVLKLEILSETDTTASIEVFLTLTKRDNTIINQVIVYTLTRPTKDDPWIISDSYSSP